MNKQNIIISCEATPVQFETAKAAVKFLASIVAEGKKPTTEQYDIMFNEVAQVINDHANLSGDAPPKIELSEFIQHIDVCSPLMLTAYMIDAKSQLADILALIAPKHFAADGKTIYHKFVTINTALALAQALFSCIKNMEDEA